jgi:pimeloyl-ACP methyl ester carboxylesterase
MRSHFVCGGNDVRLHVVEAGDADAPPILFIHGFSQSWLSWSRQLESDLAADFRLLAMDLRGHGRSDRPTDGYDQPAVWAADVDAVITTLRLERPVLAGWSYAGFVIGDYLSICGDAVIGGINLAGCATKVLPDSAGRVLGGDFLSLLPGFFSADAQESIGALDGLLRLCFNGRVPSWSEHYQALGFNASVPPYVRQALLSRTIDNDDAWRRVTCPVLVSHGDVDAVVFPSVARELAELAPNARLSMYDGAGHVVFAEDPVRFNRELRLFVDSIHRPASAVAS